MTKISKRGTTKSGGQKHALDKFYTKPEIAQFCIDKINLEDYEIIIEPSAGSGSFSNLIKNVKAFDLEPEHENIVKQDWFEYHHDSKPAEKVLVIGNPPFGQQNNLAIRFINHAAEFATTIAFILPISFMKESIQNRINRNFWLTDSFILPKKSFTLNNEELDVPCVFQIWNFSEDCRIIESIPIAKGFKFVKKEQEPDFYVQRVGGKAGTIGKDVSGRSKQSNYFIKALSKDDVNILFEDFSKLVHPSKDYGVGPRSISKKEVLLELKEIGSKFVE